MPTGEFGSRLTQSLLHGTVSQVTWVVSSYFQHMSWFGFLLMVLPVYVCFISVVKQGGIVEDLLHSILVNTALQAVQVRERGLSILNMWMVYMVGTSFSEDYASGSAQYILVMQVCRYFPVDSLASLVAAGVVYLAVERMEGRLRDTVQMVVTYVVQNWFLSVIPADTYLVCMFVLLYSIYPFLEKSKKAAYVYNFLIFNTTSKVNIIGVGYWVQALVFAVVWVMDFDKVASAVSENVSVRLLQLSAIQSIGVMARTDPVFVYGVVLVTLQFFSN